MEKNVRIGMEEVSFALSKISPIIITYIIVGISFGILAYDAGLSLMWTFLSSVFIYAGSAQITLVALLKAGVPFGVIFIMGLALAGRFAFYGLSLQERYKAVGRLYPYLIFGLTDEAYSVMVSIDYPDGINENGVNVFITLAIHITWVVGSVLGHVFGQSIGLSIEGLDFMLTAFFITVVIGKWQGGYKFSVISSLVASFLCILAFGTDRFIIPAIVLSIVFILIQGRLKGGSHE